MNTNRSLNNLWTIFKQLGVVNTIRLNFQYMPFRKAIRFPIIASRYLRIRQLKGKVDLGIISTGIISIGFDYIGIFDNKRSRSIWDVGETGLVIFQGKAKFGNGCKISVGGKLNIGSNFTMSGESSIVCMNSISIGDGCLISWDVLIMDTDFHYIYNNRNEQINQSKPIIVGSQSWIGCRAMILKGVEIASNTVIAAGSLITKSESIPYSVIGGNPQRILYQNIIWKQ